jgi:UTP--glucose-1-phosphate uridylyltransferase
MNPLEFVPGSPPATRPLPLSNSMNQFLSQTKEAAQTAFDRHVNDLKASISRGNPRGQPFTETEKVAMVQELNDFSQVFYSYLKQRGHTIDWNQIKLPPEGMIVPYDQLKPCEDKSALLSKLVVLKLNGGLGTTMGCVGPKSAIEVHSKFTFLDLTVHQIEHLNKENNSNVPLLLMNSFNTHEMTQKILRKYQRHRVDIQTFNQSRYPRIYKETLLPMPEDINGKPEDWYPPGHGDVYPALHNSGLLDKYISEGKEYIFISNVDNLGATVDLKILQYMDESGNDFIMEVTDKTRADVKGGTLIDYEGKAKLLEIAQCPPDKVEEFKSIKKFKIFNTNNLWVRLDAIKHLVESNVLDQMDIIVNNKVLDGGVGVIQLERAAGAAMQYFEKAQGINVPRSRFLPVKSTSDLFVVQSNLYSLSSGSLVMNPARQFPTVPTIKLGEHFTKVGQYNKRFKSIPDILELDHLTVSGDVTFGAGVTLAGTVIIVANHGNRIDIPDGSRLENKVVSAPLDPYSPQSVYLLS